MSDFLEEIKTQPGRLRDLVSRYRSEGYHTVKKAATLMRSAAKVVFSGMGTSFFTPKCVISELRQVLHAFIVEPGEIIEAPESILSTEDILVLLSQSGESVETAAVAKAMKGRVKIIGITNDTDSTLARSSDVILDLCAGEEKSITNKTFTNTLAVLYLLSRCCVSGDPEALEQTLLDAADLMQQILDGRMDEIAAVAADLAPADWMHFIGRSGVSMTLANQSALVFMEGAATYTCAFSTGAFRHGPIEICSPEYRAVMYYQGNDNGQVMCSLEKQISTHGGRVYIITDQPCPAARQFRIDSSSAIVYSFSAAMFMELLLVQVAAARGRTAGVFSITKKICTVE